MFLNYYLEAVASRFLKVCDQPPFQANSFLTMKSSSEIFINVSSFFFLYLTACSKFFSS